MKIGILTHHYINNFGAFLQAYALQTALQEMYPNDEVQIIDCMNVKHFVINAGGWFRFYKNKETLSDWLQKIKLPITFAKARKKYMALTPTCYNAKDIEKLGLDYIVVGSDEVWNYQETKGNAKVKFGVGLEKEKLVAYAPSVGQTHETDVPEYVKTGILKFKAVSARDQLTEELAEKIRNEEIERVTDPTFLVHIPDEEVPVVTQPYMLFYYCDGLSEVEKQKLIDYAHKNGMAVYGAGECDKRYTDITVNLTPFQWVWMFRNAACVVTGTFHGAVFSMLNHRQFACYLTNPLDVFAEVHKLDEKAQLVLLGDGELMEAVKQKAEKLNLEKNITFVGNVGNANEWYQAFDCFVLPSIWEGLPVVGVEAQAADLPCVFSANVTREIGFSERAEFVGLDEPLNKWARTIGKALLQTDRVDRTDLITKKHYNIEVEAERLQERYLQLYKERCQA